MTHRVPLLLFVISLIKKVKTLKMQSMEVKTPEYRYPVFFNLLISTKRSSISF